MKTARILLLALLVLVLPMRGAWAGLGHCTGAASERAVITAVAATAHEHAAALSPAAHTHHVEMAGHLQGEAPSELPAEQVSVSDAGDTCKFCTSSCSATPFVSTPPALSAFTTAALATFPALTPPPPSHLSEGPDRPPQSL